MIDLCACGRSGLIPTYGCNIVELTKRLWEWKWRMKWSTVSEDRISEIIRETAPRYGIKYVAFKSDSPDGIVRPRDTLDVYVVNKGGMSYFDLAKFSGEVMTAMNRDAFFHPMGRKTKKSDLAGLGATIAYEESPVSEG